MGRLARWDTRIDSTGSSYAVWEPPLPRVHDVFLDCVFYLYPDLKSAEEGSRLGGSGFLIGIPIPGITGVWTMLFVTNKHVVERGNSVLRLNDRSGGTFCVEVDERSWIFHEGGDDLAIACLKLDQDRHRYAMVPLEDFITKDLISQNMIGPGDDTFMVGRFIHNDGCSRNIPTVRFGNIAQMPYEIIAFSDETEQESFLVEARSIPGFSGSPVFVQINTWSAQSGSRTGVGWKTGTWLLGINHCHTGAAEPVRNNFTGEPINNTWCVKNNTGLMGVIPVWRLAEMLAMPELAAFIDHSRSELRDQYPNHVDSCVKD